MSNNQLAALADQLAEIHRVLEAYLPDHPGRDEFTAKLDYELHLQQAYHTSLEMLHDIRAAEQIANHVTDPAARIADVRTVLRQITDIIESDVEATRLHDRDFPPGLVGNLALAAQRCDVKLDQLVARLRVEAAGSAIAATPTPRTNAPALTEDELLALRALQRVPYLLKAVDLAEHIKRDRKTTGKLLRDLEKTGHVHRPNGPRQGYGLTEAGRRVVDGGDA